MRARLTGNSRLTRTRSLFALSCLLALRVTGAAAAGETAGSFRHETADDPPAKSTERRTGPAARPQIEAFTSIQVNVAGNGANIQNDAANEPSIAVDPTNPNRIAIGWRQFGSVLSNFRQAGYGWSDDGGRTWHFPGALTPGTFRSDPVLGYDAAGTFFYSSLQSVGGNLTTDYFRSTNGGQSWSGPYYAYGGDKQWIQVDRTGGMGDGNIYQAWSTAAGCCFPSTFNRSLDGGFSSTIPNTIPSTPVWGTMDVASDGTLWLVGVDPNNLGRFLWAKSSSAKDPMSIVVFESSGTFAFGGTMAVAIPTGPNPDGLLGQIWLTVDRTNGPRAGWIYAVCSIDPPGTDPLDVHFVRSTNGGMTWSTPVRINTDATTRWQWNATMSLAPNGRLDVVWNDTRASDSPNLSRLFYSSSSDGGTTWSANTVASPEWDSYLGFPNQNKIGDYCHMISDDVGAHLAWAATFNFEQDVYYLRIGDYDCNGNGVGDTQDIATLGSHDYNFNGIPDECEGITTSDVAVIRRRFELLPNVPNPFNPRTTIAFVLPRAESSVSLHVFDLHGKLVRTLLEGEAVDAGRTTISWDGLRASGTPASSGLYVYRLEAPGFVASRKMLLVK